MKKIRQLSRWIFRILDEVSTYKVDGRIRGKAFLYHSGSIVNMQVINDNQQIHSMTTNSTNPNMAQMPGLEK